jgi:predicted RNase H-like nuclease (RuvC/YqgF family)
MDSKSILGKKDYFKDTSASEREHEYFERILDLTYENGNLKAENQELKRENSRFREKLKKAYEFMR